MQKIKSVEKAMEIINYLGRVGSAKTLTEIARELHMGKSTVYRILKTMESFLFIRQDDNNKYSLGVKLYVIGMRSSADDAFLQMIRPHVQRLHRQFDEVVNVSILDKSRVDECYSMVLHKEQNENRVIVINPQIGNTIECYCSSVGKCLLAFSDEVHLERYKNVTFKKYTEHTISSYEELMEEIKRIRKQGYAVDDQEQEKDLFCIGVPILNERGSAVAAMSISGRKDMVLSHGKETIVKALLESSRRITIELYS